MSSPVRLRSGLVSVTFRHLPPREIVALAAAHGLEGIEWGGDVHVPDPTAAREAQKMTEDAGRAVAAYGSYWRAQGEFGPVAEIAALLDAPTIRVWAGREGSASADDATKIRVADALRQACAVAAGGGMTISLEYHAGTLTDTLDSTLRLVRRVDHPALRLFWQPVPERPPSERLEEVRTLLPWLSNLHVFQWTRFQGEIRRQPLSQGGAEWSAVFRSVSDPNPSLPQREESRFALLEFVPDDAPSLLSREAATLRRLLAEPS